MVSCSSCCCATPSSAGGAASPRLILPCHSRHKILPPTHLRLFNRPLRTRARHSVWCLRPRDIAGEPFDETPHRKAARSYAARIRAHFRSRRWREVLSVFVSMTADGAAPDRFLLPKILKACSELGDWRTAAAIHGYMITASLEADVFVGNSLIDMYAKCGDLASAHAVFERMPERDVVSWTALVNANADAGLLDEAEVMFQSMRDNGIRPDLISWNALISGFARNGEPNVALSLFEAMQGNGIKPGANSWNGVISGLVQNGSFEEALEVFREMCLHEKPNAVTIASVLPACSGLGVLNLGRQLHSYVLRNEVKMNIFVGGSLIDMYLKCGKSGFAESVFAELENRNVSVWNSMIAMYLDENKTNEALDLLDLMHEDGLMPDVITYNTFLAAHARMGEREEALKFLSEMSQIGLKPNVVSLNALISGFHHSGLNKDALDFFRLMQLPNFAGTLSSCLPVDTIDVVIEPNAVSITSVLSVCADLKLQHLGKEIHGFILRNFFECNVFVSSALVDMYAKCGNMFCATKVFHGIKDRNVVSWNILMAGYNHNENPEAALKLFLEMLEQNFSPSPITMMILLLSCSNTMALRVGKELHSRIEKEGPDGYLVNLSTALINMYAKCGSIEDAKLVFHCAVKKDLAVWNAIMAACSLHKMTTDVLDLFKQMEETGFKPDHITFTAILSACNQTGFLEEGCKHFKLMEDVYGISPTLEHVTCMVDIMGTAGLLEEAVDFIRRMPFKPDACMWATLLKACRQHSNFEIGERAARALLELEPKNSTNHILLCNTFGMAGLWDSSMTMRNALRDQGLKMVNACSWIEIGTTIHAFKAGDSSHPEMEKIMNVWNMLADKMLEAGYASQSIMFCDQEKVDPFTCYHPEKLAVCLGIISLHSSSLVRISKNVRMCIDCHSSIKFISRFVEREIFIKDSCFYHHFKHGNCSCGDRW